MEEVAEKLWKKNITLWYRCRDGGMSNTNPKWASENPDKVFISLEDIPKILNHSP